MPIAGSRLAGSQHIVANVMVRVIRFNPISGTSIVARIASSQRMEDGGRLTLLLWSCSKKPVVREDIGLAQMSKLQIATVRAI